MKTPAAAPVPMKTLAAALYRCWVLALFVTYLSGAQTPANRSAADTAWQTLTALRTPPASAAATPSPATPMDPNPPGTPSAPAAAAASAPGVAAKRTAVQATSATQQEADHSRSVAQAARDFYTRFPAEANAVQARKLEATAALNGLKSATPAQAQAALRVAGDFRHNQGNPPEDRFDVALAMDRFQSTKAQGGRPLHKNPQAYEKLAYKLRAEFGDRPEVFRLYAGIANQLEPEAAHTLAQRIIQMPAKAHIKSQAQDIIERHALLGHRLDLQLTTIDRRPVDLKNLVGGPTVLYLRSVGAGNPYGGLAALRKSVPVGTQWVYLFLGQPLASVTAAKGLAPYAGSICHEPLETMQRVDERLHLRTSPYVFVLNRQGLLSGYGPVDELATLLAAANR